MDLMTESVVGEFAPVGPLPTIVIEPAPRWPGINVREMWANRELLMFLVWRDVKVQYAQTVLGAAWAVVQPLMTMVIFTLIFGRLAKIPSDGVPYSVFTLAALIPWMYFSNAFSAASSSLVNEREPDHEGVLSAADHPDRVGAVGTREFRGVVRRACGR